MSFDTNVHRIGWDTMLPTLFKIIWPDWKKNQSLRKIVSSGRALCPRQQKHLGKSWQHLRYQQ
jgi:hypothetical protein